MGTTEEGERGGSTGGGLIRREAGRMIRSGSYLVTGHDVTWEAGEGNGRARP